MTSEHEPDPEGAVPNLGMVRLDGGDFLMGTDGPWAYEGDGEGPVHQVTLDPFWIGTTTVTNAAFATFVDATGHVTDAERYEWSFVFAGLLPDDFEDTRAVAQTPWWRQVFGATWRTPEGPQSDIAGRADHPVVHVSWLDASAYADVGRRAPPDRSRMGVRGTRRTGRAAVPVGERPRARRRAPHERVAGQVPHREHPGRRLLRHRAGHRVPAQRLRPVQRDRQRVGVVRGLVRPGLLPARRRP